MRAEKCVVQFVYKGNIIFELYNTQNKHHTPAAPVVCKKEYLYVYNNVDFLFVVLFVVLLFGKSNMTCFFHFYTILLYNVTPAKSSWSMLNLSL